MVETQILCFWRNLLMFCETAVRKTENGIALNQGFPCITLVFLASTMANLEVTEQGYCKT